MTARKPMAMSAPSNPRTVKALALRFQYLDQLRESGVTNMYGAAPFVQIAFGVGRKKATKTVLFWMQTFASDKSPKDRARAALETQQATP